jgi:putative restriction endonuclease
MRLFVGITDRQWFDQLSTLRPDEVNFWKPGESGSFAALQPGELFLFKLHSPNDLIVGGAHFVKFSRLPVSVAWASFGVKNGVASLPEFLSRIRKYRKVEPGPDPSIGNIVLTQPFWFDRSDWIPVPNDWSKNIVQGKSYDALDSRGFELWSEVQARLGNVIQSGLVREAPSRYSRTEVDVRLGQGAFRILVTDAYDRRCAMTGENTLPVLEAAHIRPYAEDGPHSTENGLLLRSDMHILFDKGLLTLTPDLRWEVSGQIREQYANGKLYYSYHGQELRSTPANRSERPSREFLEWHNENVFRA